MQAGGFPGDVADPEKIYKDDKPGLSAAMKDNLEFINTHPNLVGFLMGLLISMEEKEKTATPLKASKWRCLAQSPGLAMRFSGLPCCQLWRDLLIVCQSGEPVGTDFVFSPFTCLSFFLRVGWTHVGYSVGVKAIDKVRENSQMIAVRQPSSGSR